MNPRVVKPREEREKNAAKIASLQERNKKIDADVIRIENTDIGKALPSMQSFFNICEFFDISHQEIMQKTNAAGGRKR